MSARRRRRALLTGASGGIGAATARLLLRSGFDLALMGRRGSELERLAVLARASGAEALVLPADLADRAAVDQAADELLARWPELHAVILNAGANAPTPLDGPDVAAFDRILEVNLTSGMRLARRLLPHVADEGRILAVASVLGRFGIPDYHGYCASKAGMIGFARALALELAPRRICVNAVVPGWVETAMAEKAIAAQAPAMGLAPEEARARFLDRVPLKRMVRPPEVAHLILSLLSTSAGAVTGQAINIDGGVMA